eukprot:4613417-Ditylum_brightwellii.AAC.1
MVQKSSRKGKPSLKKAESTNIEEEEPAFPIYQHSYPIDATKYTSSLIHRKLKTPSALPWIK